MLLQFDANLESKFKKNTEEIAPSNGAIWDKFIEQCQHQSIKKRISFRARFALFLMHIRCKFNAQFGWG